MAMAETTGLKICVQCGDDCAGKPRTKDAKGRYVCRPCFDKVQAKSAKPASPAPLKGATPITPAPGDVDNSLLLALADEEARPVATTPCPSCGAGMMNGAVICTTCGYNVQTKKNMRSVVERERGGGRGGSGSEGGSSPTVAAALVALPTLLLMGSGAAVVGGAVGAGIWAAIAYNTHYHIRIIAVLVGVLTGAGMRMGVRGYAGGLTGALAAVIAAGAIAGGHYWTVSMMVDEYVKRQPSARATVTEEFAKAQLADAIIERHQKAGVTDAWPAGSSAEDAEHKDDFPPAVWKEAEAEWTKKTPAERDQMKTDLQALVKEQRQEFASAVKVGGFMASFGLFDVIWFASAMVAAFLIGSGRDLNGNDA
jgi:hypothetical protein